MLINHEKEANMVLTVFSILLPLGLFRQEDIPAFIFSRTHFDVNVFKNDFKFRIFSLHAHSIFEYSRIYIFISRSDTDHCIII